MSASDSMTQSKQVTTGNIIAAAALVIMTFGAEWTLMQASFTNVENSEKLIRLSIADKVGQDEFKQFLTRFSSLNERLGKLEVEQSHAAHTPVEKDTLDAIIAASDKRVEILQNSINDLNRQIAAALIIIDNNAGVHKTSPSLPP